ncbi:MAG: hypothetical protein HC847_18335 [Hydrococcus sp. RU_2_2]|nr:hypothetical protein [Hydrococcus sp. RU_2_2]
MSGLSLKAISFARWQKAKLDEPIANQSFETLDDLDIESSLFEQAATVWNQHPVPDRNAIAPWIKAFCSRREQLKDDKTDKFQESLTNFITHLWKKTLEEERDTEVQNWLKLAAFVLRNREIKLGGQG